MTGSIIINVISSSACVCHSLWDHPNIHYFVVCLRLTDPYKLSRNTLLIFPHCLILLPSVNFCSSKIFKAVFLLAFFGVSKAFKHCPHTHSISSLDPSRHLTAGNLTFHTDSYKSSLNGLSQFRAGTGFTCSLSLAF